MATKYYAVQKYSRLPLVRAMFATNLGFALAVLLAWQSVIMPILDPLAWGADRPVPSDVSMARLLEYPLLVFWAGPVAAMCAGWVLMENRRYKTALGVMLVPLLVFVLMFVMHALVPNVGA
jgi:hypothetical protein